MSDNTNRARYVIVPKAHFEHIMVVDYVSIKNDIYFLTEDNMCGSIHKEDISIFYTIDGAAYFASLKTSVSNTPQHGDYY